MSRIDRLEGARDALLEIVDYSEEETYQEIKRKIAHLLISIEVELSDEKKKVNEQVVES